MMSVIKRCVNEKTMLPSGKEEKNEEPFSIMLDPLPATTGPGPIFGKDTHFDIFSRFFEDITIFLIT
jgi:hypothetical protein